MIAQWSKSYGEFLDDILYQLSPHHISSAVCLLSELTKLDDSHPDVLDLFLRIDSSRNQSMVCGPLPDNLWLRMHHTDFHFQTDSPIDMIAVKLINAGYFAFIGSLDKSSTFPFYQILYGGDAETVFKMLHNRASKIIAGEGSEQSPNPSS
jgi:hypothetical protein